MKHKRGYCSCTISGSGTLYVAGGIHNNQLVKNIEWMDFRNNEWSDFSSLETIETHMSRTDFQMIYVMNN